MYNAETQESNVPGLYLAGVVQQDWKRMSGLLKIHGHMLKAS